MPKNKIIMPPNERTTAATATTRLGITHEAHDPADGFKESRNALAPLPLLAHALVYPDGRIKITLCSQTGDQDNLMPTRMQLRKKLYELLPSYSNVNVCGFRRLLTIHFVPFPDKHRTKAQREALERMEKEAKNMDVFDPKSVVADPFSMAGMGDDDSDDYEDGEVEE